MRLVYLILIILFAAAAVVFVIQNRDTVTISFLAACRTWVCILPEVAAGDAGAV